MADNTDPGHRGMKREATRIADVACFMINQVKGQFEHPYSAQAILEYLVLELKSRI